MRRQPFYMVEVHERKVSGRWFFRVMSPVGFNTKMGYRRKGFEDRREVTLRKETRRNFRRPVMGT
jgi:hypothetical protein